MRLLFLFILKVIIIRSSAGSVSVFEVGICFRYFFGFFQKSVRFSVSIFQNIAISVRFFGFIHSFVNLQVGGRAHII